MTKKFVGSMVTINKEVDMDIELVKSMLGNEAGRVELYKSAASVDGEIFIVDGDVARADSLAGMLNDAFNEFMEMESVATNEEVGEARDVVNTAFEGDSRVPVSESAEDAAIANLNKKRVTQPAGKKNTATKTTEKAEITMTNQTNANTEANKVQSNAAKAFLASQEGKMQNAKQSPKKGKETAPKSNKPSVGVKNEEKKEQKKATPAKSAVTKPNVNTKSEEMTNMTTTNNETKGNRTTAGATNNRKSAGTTGTTVKLNTAKAQSAGNRIEFQEAANKFTRFQGPWYLNAGLHEVVDQLEELIAMRQLAELGIKDIRFVDPSTVLSYTNHDIKSIVELTLEGKDGKDQAWNVRIKEETRDGKTADLNSPNVGWDNTGGDLKPVYQVYKKNEENMVTFTVGAEGKTQRLTTALSKAIYVEAEETLYYTAVDADGVVDAYSFDYTTGEIAELSPKQYTIQSYVPVIKEEVTTQMVVLALGFAQYAHGYNMHGVVEEA